MMNNDKIRQRVLNIYSAFVTDVDPNRLSDYLKEKGIISIEQWQDMCGKNPTDRHRCRALLDFLLSGNDPRAFVVVRNVLEKENHYLLGEIDDEPSCLTEDKKTIKLLQFELQSQEKRLQEVIITKRTKRWSSFRIRSYQTLKYFFAIFCLLTAQAEIEKFRRRVAEMESELARYHHKEKSQPNQSLSIGQREFDDDGSGYVNESQAQQLNISSEQTIDKKRVAAASLSVPCFVEAGYANSRQNQQRTRVEQTPPKKEAVWNSLRGTLKRETASHWSNPSTVGKIAGNGKAIIGVTVLRQKVYVIHDNSSQIQTYDSSTLNWLSDFKLKDLHEPKHLTSCGLHNCLYLTGLTNQTVYKAEGTGNAVLLTWKTEGNFYSLSTTKDGTVILAAFTAQTVKEYTAYGTLLRTIILKPDASRPIAINHWHAIKLESGNYLISHGQSRASKHRVCMISPDGDVLKSFGDEKGSEMNGLFGPYHLALDEKGNILVADCNNHRIVVLSPVLEYVTEIKTELRYPTTLCFDSSTGSLYVADNELQTGGKRTDGQIVVLQPKN